MLLQELIIPLKMDSSQFNKETKGAKSKAGDLVSKLLAIGSTVAGIVSVSAAIAGITKATLGAFNATKDWALQLDSIQDVMGVSNEKAATYAFVAKKAGVNIESLTNAQTILAKQLVDAKGELDTTGKALKEWGVNVLDANGKLKDQSTITDEIAKKYSELGSQTERVAFLNDAFGRSGADLIDFFDTLAADGGVDAVTEKVKKLGLALDPAKFEEFQRSQEELKLTWLGLQATLGQALLPTVQEVMNKLLQLAQNPKIQETLQNAITGIREFFKDPQKGLANIEEFVKNIDWNSITTKIAEGIKSVDWNKVGKTVSDTVAQVGRIIWEGLKNLIQNTNWTALFDSIATAAVDFFFGLGGITKEMFASVVMFYVEKYKNMIQQFFIDLNKNTVGKVAEIISNIKNKFLGFDWNNLGSNIIKGIANGIRNSIGWITDAAREAARAALTAAKNFLGIHSPSKVFEMQVGYQMAAGTVKGWESGLDNLLQPSFNNLIPATSSINSSANVERSASNVIDYERLARAFAMELQKVF